MLMEVKKRRKNWRRLALLRGAEIRAIKKHRQENKKLHKNIVILLQLLDAVDKQGRNGNGWKAHGEKLIQQNHNGF